MEYYSDEYLLKKISVVENKEILVDVSKHVKNIIVKKTNVLGENAAKILVRKSVAKMLEKASIKLPSGYKFIIYDGYRNKKTQKRYFLNYLKKVKKQHPGWSGAKIKKEASKYVANPESFCPHLTGGAVDVSLAKGKRQISMGGFIDKKHKSITRKIKGNRKILALAMEQSGFVNYPLEWWHWSYGDMYWAAVKKKKYAIYGYVKEEGFASKSNRKLFK